MWLYTVLRFALFFALWGLLWAARVPGLLAATIALVLSIPLSYILLRKQRARLAANLEARVNARHAQREELDAKLAGGESTEGAVDPAEWQPSDPSRRSGPDQAAGGSTGPRPKTRRSAQQ